MCVRALLFKNSTLIVGSVQHRIHMIVGKGQQSYKQGFKE